MNKKVLENTQYDYNLKFDITLPNHEGELKPRNHVSIETQFTGNIGNIDHKIESNTDHKYTWDLSISNQKCKHVVYVHKLKEDK